MSNNNTRPKTNSITHLVKIVAKEVCDESMHSRYQHIMLMKNEINDLKSAVKKLQEILFTVKVTNLNIDTKEALKKVHNDLLKAGGLWTDDEDTLLERELNVAVNAMAANHQRSKGAIKSRLQKMMQYGLNGLDDI